MNRTPDKDHSPFIKDDRKYEVLRREGYGKELAERKGLFEEKEQELRQV